MRILVAGLGNVLMSDDGFGPQVIRALAAGWEPATGVTFEDLGTPGLDLMPFVMGTDVLVLVDTVKSPVPPGTLRTYRKAEILAHAPHARTSPHDPGVKEALLMADLAGHGPSDVLLVGVVPAETSLGTGLSRPVQDAVPAACAAVLGELERLGRPAIARVEPDRAVPWWDRSAT